MSRYQRAHIYGLPGRLSRDTLSRMLGVPRRGVIILLPALNERDNIAELLDRIEFTLRLVPPTGGIVDNGSLEGAAGYVGQQTTRAMAGCLQ